jgi:hypothetical protein
MNLKFAPLISLALVATASQSAEIKSIEHDTVPSEEKWNVPNPINNGYLFDADKDGIVDHMILKGDTVYFSKSANTPAKVLFKLKEPILAYRIDTSGILFFNIKSNAFLMPLLGVGEDKLPLFGTAEQQ